MNTSIPIFKIVVLGEGRVGKTSMTLKYVKNQFNEDQQSSINACYLEKDLKLFNGEKTVKMAIWDTAGQQKYNAVAPVYYRDAMGAVVVYEIVSTESFEKVKKWVKQLREHANNKEIVIYIAGNKADMESQRRVPRKQAQTFAKQSSLHHFEVSAKSGHNINQLFKNLGEQIYNVRKKNDTLVMGGRRNPRLRVQDTKQKKKKKDECCSKS